MVRQARELVTELRAWQDRIARVVRQAENALAVYEELRHGG